MTAKPERGAAIFRSVDAGTELQVRDEGQMRYLYIENDSIQSAMDLANPAALPVAYTRYMAGALLLNPRPRRALMIGLGGGGLVRFLQRCAPQCEIDVVETRSDVIHAAREFFAIAPGPTMRVWHGDGAEYLRQRAADDARYDIIFMDAFDHRGLAAPARDAEAYAACATLTRPRGMLLCNLWASAPQEFRYCRGLAERYFPGRVVAIPVPQRSNVVLIARHDELATPRAQMDTRANELYHLSGVALSDIAQHYHAYQNSLWQKLGLQRFGRTRSRSF